MGVKCFCFFVFVCFCFLGGGGAREGGGESALVP